MNDKRAFSLIELLVVIAIIAVLSAVLYPVITGARQRSKRTVCISNLRQCGVALKLYMDDYGTKVPPDDSSARAILAKAPVCCPNDTEWKGCSQPFGLPMIGSYAYVRSVPGMEMVNDRTLEWWFGNDERECIWMVDIFHSSHGIPAPYHAEIPDRLARHKIAPNDPDPIIRLMMPDNMVKLYADSHVDVSKPTTYHHGDLVDTFTWESAMKLTACLSSESPCTPEQREKWLPSQQ